MNIQKFIGKEVSHEEKYRTVVEAIGLQRLISYLPADKKEIQKALKEDNSLNNIPLQRWDDMHLFLRGEFKKIGINSISLAETVCTLKQAARMYANS